QDLTPSIMRNVNFENGKYGLRAVLTGAWSGSLEQYLSDEPVAELELNHAKGWRGTDLSFLTRFQHIKSFSITDFTITSVKPIHLLSELKSLDVITYCKTKINFSAFPQLEECGLEWRPGAESLFNCATLRDLFINRYKGTDTDPFQNLTNLKLLAILNSSITNVSGLKNLKQLRSLRLGNLSRLSTLEGIELLANLEELDINTCQRIHSIKELASVKRLKRLHLNNCGPIESLKPLNELRELEAVIFYESTNIQDGDLSPLLRQTKLSRLSFQNRRHYSHRREDFGLIYSNPDG